MSPGSKSFVSAQPCGSITVVRTRPLMTNAHSAAVACQCSSRIAPGSKIIETPAIPFEIGSCSTVASRPTLPPITLPDDFSSSNLNVGKFLAGQKRIGSVVAVHSSLDVVERQKDADRNNLGAGSSMKPNSPQSSGPML